MADCLSTLALAFQPWWPTTSQAPMFTCRPKTGCSAWAVRRRKARWIMTSSMPAGPVLPRLRAASYMDSAASFGMIRGGHVDATVIGAFEVDQKGNIANWIIPNGKQLGVGGAMDLVTGAREVVIAMQHTSKNGKPKLVKQCILPITGLGEADMVVTEYAVFVFDKGRLILREIAPEITLDELRNITDADFAVDL